MGSKKSRNETKINQLLRLAELCDSDDTERKKKYMDMAESLLFATSENLPEHDSSNGYVRECDKHLIPFYKEYKGILLNVDCNLNYDLYLKYCTEKNIAPLPFLVFCMQMCRIFNLKSKAVRQGTKVIRTWENR